MAEEKMTKDDALVAIKDGFLLYGKHLGLEEAQNFLLDKSVKLFLEGKDKDAILVRDLMKDIRVLAEKALNKYRDADPALSGAMNFFDIDF